MKVLVTGSSGFLGRFLVKSLKKQGHEVTTFSSSECDLTKSDSLNQFNDIKFDQIYHLAAWIQAGDFHLYHSGEIWTKNQLINSNVLTWWKDHQQKAKMITMGTSCAYEPGRDLIEEHYLKGSPHASLYPYAMTKRMLYVGLEALHKQYGMEYLCFVPSTLYGPGYHNDQRQLHFIFDLMRKISRAKYQGIPAVLWGDGYQKRELVLVQDFVNVVLKLSQSQSNQLINIGAGTDFSIREFATIICEAIDYDPKHIQYDVTKFVGAKSKCLNINKLKNLLPELQYTSLKKGITDTVHWFIEEHQSASKH